MNSIELWRPLSANPDRELRGTRNSISERPVLIVSVFEAGFSAKGLVKTSTEPGVFRSRGVEVRGQCVSGRFCLVFDSVSAIVASVVSVLLFDRRGCQGPKSETFCRQTLTVLAQNPQVIPPSIDLAEAQADLAALDRLRSRLTRLQRLAERG